MDNDVPRRFWRRPIFYALTKNMPRCLNPKKAHENRGQFARPVPSGTTLALTDSPSIETREQEEEQVSCQFCKYLLAGAMLGDCRILRWIGSGAFGDVYEAEQLPPLSRRVAIKVMSIEQVVDGQSVEMFAREVSTIAALDHPNILPVLRVGMIEDGRSYLVMKYAAQGSLQKFCQPAAPALSFMPTVNQVNLVESTPTDALAIVAAETLPIIEVVEKEGEQANGGKTETPADNDQTERLLKPATSEQATLVNEAFVEGKREALIPPTPSDEEAQESASEEPEQTRNGIRGKGLEQASTVALAEQARPPETALSPTVQGKTGIILSPQEVLGFVIEASAALQYAHNHGLIHLDVKPANLLLDAQGRLLLADFGVSVLLEGYTHASLHCYVGTPLYTAPEQWLEQPRAASDQYALAITCYQLLTGRAPFTGNLYSVMHGHLQTPPPPLSEFNPLIPEQVELVILRALAKDPNARYPDMLAFANAYREAVENAASASTDTGIQKQVSRILEQRGEMETALRLPETETTDPPPHLETGAHALKVNDPSEHLLKDSATERPERPRRHRLRNLLLILLLLILLGGGGLGFVRFERPCWLGICANIGLSASDINLTNNASQEIKLSNFGTDDLSWQATFARHYPWLTLTPTSGNLAPGKSTMLLLKARVDDLSQSGVYAELIEIHGGQGVLPKSITVTETVVKGLEAVSISTTGNSFVYEQGQLTPRSLKITINNNSGRALSWFTQVSDNNWFQVMPSEGTLDDRQTVDLTVTVKNLEGLVNNTYLVKFSLVGSLDKRPELMQTLDFTLRVNAAATPTSVPATPTPQSPISFTAQPVVEPGGPDTARSAHSMVWDSQSDQLLIFGGIDNQGNLLNDLWSYSPGNRRWTNLTTHNPDIKDCSGSPMPRMNAAMVWDSVHEQVLLYGGQSGNGSYLGDLWAYSPSSNVWTALACENAPGARAGAGVVWNGNQMLILGGNGTTGPLADFWAYTPGTNASWKRISTSAPLGARAYPTMVWDATNNQLLVFGGLKASKEVGDFYVYRPGEGWQGIVASNDSPLPRQQAAGAWDSKDGVFLLLGGWQASDNTTYSALWAYSPAKNAWWQIVSLQNSSVTSIIPSRSASAMIWDSTDNRAFVYAGAGGASKTAYGDLWTITPVPGA